MCVWTSHDSFLHIIYLIESDGYKHQFQGQIINPHLKLPETKTFDLIYQI
jgi:hypothetical protein